MAQCLNEHLDYSQNPVKTEKGELISSYACDPETAAMEFLLSKRQYQQVTGQEYKGNIIAYQIRQFFKLMSCTGRRLNCRRLQELPLISCRKERNCQL